MNLSLSDWSIVGVLFCLVCFVAIIASRWNRSVADFLAANRCASRYLLCVAEGMASVGAISIVASLQVYSKAGFTSQWWTFISLPVSMLLTLSGWVVYRFRQTRAMTLAQFFEMRYSKSFRVFMGLLGYSSGIITFGIFPAVGARFFIYFCGLPQHIDIFGIHLATFVLIILVLLSISLAFTFMGGQIAIMLTDFIQGSFVNIALLTMVFVSLKSIGWSRISETLLSSADTSALVNPLRTAQVKDFNVWFYAIETFGTIYCWMAWQCNQGFNCSALNPHEAKMGKILGSWRQLFQMILFITLAVCGFTFLHHPSFAGSAEKVRSVLAGMNNSEIRDQMQIPMAMLYFLPTGLIGAFAAVMLAAFIASTNTWLHTWGSMFVQDVLVPLRKKPFTPSVHIWILRGSIFFVAMFIFYWSLFFRETQHITLYFAITGAIYTGGAGSVIIGGLYWARGTARAAWCAMFTGSSLAVTGVIIYAADIKFPINGQVMWFIAMVSSCAVYAVVSLADRKKTANMDKILHLGNYAVEKKDIEQTGGLSEYRKTAFNDFFAIGPQFSIADKMICRGTAVWYLGWFGVGLIGTIYGNYAEVSDAQWLNFWKVYMAIGLGSATIVTCWMITGGIIDSVKMFKALKAVKRDHTDDGTVIDDNGQRQKMPDHIKTC